MLLALEAMVRTSVTIAIGHEQGVITHSRLMPTFSNWLHEDFSNLLLEETKQAVQFREKGAPPYQAKGLEEMVRPIPQIPKTGSP